eukprot:TRINITY_DN14608_c0_g1_i2.p1 TRINITY_DN14608_c0_g1~~TRINITY_DN14608_c0_g1_i2.p1  ORF type:complete len:288 (+),score=57.89 TRINITY_DN14608_c0_g1_i2:103-966(+)
MSETKSAINERLIPVAEQKFVSSPRGVSTEETSVKQTENNTHKTSISNVQSEAVQQQQQQTSSQYLYVNQQQQSYYVQYLQGLQQQVLDPVVQQIEGGEIDYSNTGVRLAQQSTQQTHQSGGVAYSNVIVGEEEVNVGKGGGSHRGGRGGKAGSAGRTVNAAPQGPPGLFGPDDWACTSCGNVNWARRPKCNLCGAPKPGTVDQTRQGVGGGFKELDEKEIEEAKQRRKRFEEEDDDIYDDFGRVKKKHRTQQQQNSIRNGSSNYNKDKKGGKQKGALERLQGEWLV